MEDVGTYFSTFRGLGVAALGFGNACVERAAYAEGESSRAAYTYLHVSRLECYLCVTGP
jgi:hypothetical protein